jgi:hypothetical protein
MQMGKSMIKKIWLMIGNNNKQRFFRLLIIFWSLVIGFNLIFNVGYDKSKGGLYYKPLDASIEVKR